MAAVKRKAKHDLHLAQDPEADALLSADPLALLIGMALDQHVDDHRNNGGMIGA